MVIFMPYQSLGRRILEELASMGKIDLKKTMALLHKKGLKDISKEDRVRSDANRSLWHHHKIVNGFNRLPSLQV